MRFRCEWNLFRWIINGEKNKNSTTSIAFLLRPLCAHTRKDGAKIWARKRMIFWSENQICGTILIQIICIHSHTNTHSESLNTLIIIEPVVCQSLSSFFSCGHHCRGAFTKIHTCTHTHKHIHYAPTIDWIVLIRCCLFAVCLCWVVMLFFRFFVHFISGSSSLFYLHFVEPKFKNPQWRTKTIVLAVCVWLFSVNRTRIRFFSSSSSYSFASFLFFLKTSKTSCFVSCKNTSTCTVRTHIYIA